MKWSKEDQNIERWAAVFLLALTLINAARVLQVLPLLRLGYQDFTAFYSGGLMVRYGQTTHLYDVIEQYRMRHQYAPTIAVRAALPYIHPPFEALLFVPLTFISYLSACLLWTFLNLVMLVLTLKVARKTFAEIGGTSIAFVALAAAGCVPVVTALIQGQDSILLALLVTCGLASAEEGRDVRAGAVLGAGLFRFQLVLPLVLVLAARRPRLLRGFFPVAAALAAVSAVMVGWGGLGDYARVLFRVEKGGGGGAIVASMPNLHGLVAGLPGMRDSSLMALSLTLAGSVVMIGVALWQVSRRDASVRFAFAVASVVAVMASYHTLSHDLTVLLPVVLLLLVSDGRAHDNRANILFLIVVYTMFLAALVWTWLSALWCVPVVIWIFRKRGWGRLPRLESA